VSEISLPSHDTWRSSIRAITHGMSHLVGQVAVGCLADLVLWRPESFGAKPEMVLKGGQIAWAQMGDANASIPTVQPVFGRPMWGAQPSAAGFNSVVWVSQASLDTGKSSVVIPRLLWLCISWISGSVQSYGLKKTAEAVRNCRKIGKKDMKLNDSMPKMSGKS